MRVLHRIPISVFFLSSSYVFIHHAPIDRTESTGLDPRPMKYNRNKPIS
jgi:hypothetical protein